MAAETNPFTPLPKNKPDDPSMASNPYDFSTPTAATDTSGSTAPKVDTGILANAMTPAPTVQASNTAANVTGSTASTYDPSQATSSTYNAAAANGTDWNVSKDQTVQGQIAGIINSGSPLMQLAATRANDQMNARGLTNSSLAVGAGQAALYDAATPIATSDASTFAKAGSQNAANANDISKFNASNTTDASKYAADAANTTSQFNTNAQNQASATNAAATQRTSELNAAAKNEASKADATNSLQAQISNQDTAVKQSAQAYDTATKVALQNADASGKLQLQQIDASTRTTLANIEAQYKNQMQTSQSMATTYQSMIDSVTKIMGDTNMDATAKQSAINNVTQLYNGALAVQQNISGLKLGTLLDPGTFTTSGNNSSGAGLAPPPAPAPGPGYDDGNGTGSAGSGG